MTGIQTKLKKLIAALTLTGTMIGGATFQGCPFLPGNGQDEPNEVTAITTEEAMEMGLIP